MKKRFISTLLIFLFFIACEDKSVIIDLTNECDFTNINFGSCYGKIYNYGQEQIVLTDEDAYQDFGDSIRYDLNAGCDTATLPNIDFNQYSLLGAATGGGGCGRIYHERKVLKDKDNKKIIYKINVEYYGDCEAVFGSWNWVLIPKIENGYSVEFQVTMQ